jgi:hypothetical protein
MIPWVRLGIGFYSLFLHCLGAEMSLRCRQRFSGKERCLLDHLPLFGTSCSLSFSPSTWLLPVCLVHRQNGYKADGLTKEKETMDLLNK